MVTTLYNVIDLRPVATGGIPRLIASCVDAATVCDMSLDLNGIGDIRVVPVTGDVKIRRAA